MSIAISAIAFDHQRGRPGSPTLPLRMDAATPVLLPEWRADRRCQSLAAYRIDRLGESATVLVRLHAGGESPRVIQVRALALPLPGGLPVPLLADLQPRMVVFDARGETGWLPFAFATTGFAEGVGAETAQWLWQARRGEAEAWADFDLTQHRLYAVLTEPTAPWLVRPAVPQNASLPRADMLDVACLWARGADTTAEASTRITEAVHRLGGATLSYDATVGGPHYTVLGTPRFLADAFLDRLRGGEGAGPLVNCSDCATVVSTFANLLGADLWQSKMGLVGPGFRLNPILAIGARDWSTVLGGFGFHEVAWTGACAEGDLVYDACLQIDRDGDPTVAPHAPRLPAGEPFGTPGSGQYRDRIAAPPDRAACVPQPALRVRRPIAAQAIAFAPRLPAPTYRALALRARVAEAAADPRAEEVAFEGFRPFGGELPGWLLRRCLAFDAPSQPRLLLRELPVEAQVEPGSRAVVSLWRAPERPAALLRLESIETPSGVIARRMLVQVAADFETQALAHWDRGVPGETGLLAPGGALAIFTRGNHVHVLRSAGREAADVTDEAGRLDAWLMGAGVPAEEVQDAAPVMRWTRTHVARSDRAVPAGARMAQAALAAPPVRRFVVTPAIAAAWPAR